MATTAKPTNVNEYIAHLPANIRPIMDRMRELIRTAAPNAEEVISYQMPGYKQNGMLIWFGAHTNHCGIYMPGFKEVYAAFKDDLDKYKISKGTVQFPYDQPLPAMLIKKIVKLRLKIDNEAHAAKQTAKKK